MSDALDVVIVHYTGADCLRRSVAAVRKSVDRKLRIAIVDNDAPDPLPEEVTVSPEVVVLEPGENLGFGRATNLGARSGKAEYLLLINPDATLTRAAFRAMTGILDEHPRVAACAPRLTNPDGTAQVGSAGYLPTVATVTRQALPLARLLGGKGGRSLFVAAEPRAGEEGFRGVDWLSAACMLIRRRAFEEIGGFDGRFFLYGEDIDLGKRLRERGWELAYLPRVSVKHEHLQADRGRAHRASDCAWLDGLDLYYRLHSPRLRRLLHTIGGSGFALRALAHSARRRDRVQRDRMIAFMKRSAHHALAG
ncbi:MAG: glycosyltransferase family 2 protein [Acidobacteriota bacterium]